MAKAIYLGDNTSRKVKKIYEGNGTAQKIKKGYIGDSSGKARLFYTSGYRWNKYNIQLIEQLSPAAYSYSTNGYDDVSLSWGESVQLNEDPLYCLPYGNNQGSGYILCNDDDRRVDVRIDRQLYVRWMAGSGGSGATGFTIKLINTYQYSLDVAFVINYASRTYWFNLDTTIMSIVQHYEVSAIKSQGSYIGTVESDNPAAYPDNGISGNYWYVKIVE